MNGHQVRKLRAMTDHPAWSLPTPSTVNLPWLPAKAPDPFLSSDSVFIPVTGKAGGGINCLLKAWHIFLEKFNLLNYPVKIPISTDDMNDQRLLINWLYHNHMLLPPPSSNYHQACLQRETMSKPAQSSQGSSTDLRVSSVLLMREGELEHSILSHTLIQHLHPRYGAFSLAFKWYFIFMRMSMLSICAYSSHRTPKRMV